MNSMGWIWHFLLALIIAPKYCESEEAQLSDAFVAAFDFRTDALCKYLSSSSVSQIPRVWIDSINSFLFIIFVKWYYLLAIEPSVSDLSKINKELPVKDFLTIHNKSIINLLYKYVPNYLIIFYRAYTERKTLLQLNPSWL